MKKYLIILLVGIISFFNIENVVAECNCDDGQCRVPEACIREEDTCIHENNPNNCNIDNIYIYKDCYYSLRGESNSAFEIHIYIYENEYDNLYHLGYRLSNGQRADGVYLEDNAFNINNMDNTTEFVCPNEVYYESYGGLYTDSDASSVAEPYKLIIPGVEDEVIEDEEISGNNNQCIIFGENLTPYIKSAIKIIRVLVAVLFVVMTIMDFLKVVMTGEDKSYKEATSKFVKRLIIVILIEVLPILITLLIDISGILEKYNIQGDVYCSLFK